MFDVGAVACVSLTVVAGAGYIEMSSILADQ
jgi:hypothetical protein